MNPRTLIAGLCLAILLAGCASSSVLVGTAREPIDEDQVRVLIEAPARYETVALLEAHGHRAGAYLSPHAERWAEPESRPLAGL